MKKAMSALAMLMCVLFLGLFHSCTEKEKQNDYDNYSNLIVGFWQCTEATQNGVENPYGNGVYWVFNEDGTAYTVSPYNGEEDGYYAISGNSITFSLMGYPPFKGTITQLSDSKLFINWTSPIPATNSYVRVERIPDEDTVVTPDFSTSIANTSWKCTYVHEDYPLPICNFYISFDEATATYSIEGLIDGVPNETYVYPYTYSNYSGTIIYEEVSTPFTVSEDGNQLIMEEDSTLFVYYRQ